MDKYYDEALTSAADFLGVGTENLVLVENVTTGLYMEGGKELQLFFFWTR